MPESVDGAVQLVELAGRLKAADAAMLRAMRRNLRAVVAPIAVEVAAQAATFSRTIPPTIAVRTRFTGRSAGVWIVSVSGKLAPEHRALPKLQEFGSRGSRGVIRHPVFGRDVWVDQPAHPFMRPIAAANAPAVREAMRAVMTEAALVAGFK